MQSGKDTAVIRINWIERGYIFTLLLSGLVTHFLLGGIFASHNPVRVLRLHSLDTDIAQIFVAETGKGARFGDSGQYDARLLEAWAEFIGQFGMSPIGDYTI